jgi:phosphoribosyl-AMP cyclohydrolase
MTETKKTKIEQLRDERNTKCVSICKQLNVTFAMFLNGQAIRLSKNGKIIDYYAKGEKCFWHESQSWGAVADIESFLKFEFK